MTTPLSSCCGASIRPKFKNPRGSNWYVCEKCLNPCDPEPDPDIYPCDVCGKPIEGVGVLSPSIEGPRHYHPKCYTQEPKIPKNSPYSNTTDAERRQTYDYKMGWREGMEEARAIVDSEQLNNATPYVKLWEKFGFYSWNSAVKTILKRINKKLCLKD